MTTERIKEIQSKTAYPESVSVQQALLQVWNECEQEQLRLHNVTNRTFSADDVKVLLEKQKQLCACEFIHAEMTMEQAKRRVLNAPIVSF
jgi:hypothetical protein